MKTGRPNTPEILPCATPQQELFLHLCRASEALNRQIQQVLKPYDLSCSLLHILRLLRCKGGEGLTCGQLAANLLTYDPDVTRLVNRLVRKGLVRRHRSAGDRRVIRIRLTEAGQALLLEVEPSLNAALNGSLAGLDREQMGVMTGLLRRALGQGGDETVSIDNSNKEKES